MRDLLAKLEPGDRVNAAYARAAEICDQDVAMCSAIGEHGLELIRSAWDEGGDAVNVLTHCNAGWLATVDWGTALAPVYKAHDAGIPVHVWVDETRPRNQGSGLTAWELGQHGVPHTIIVDNAGGHLMQHGRVDLCITGTDRTAASGDVCNKIGTYLKALAAFDNGVPSTWPCPAPPSTGPSRTGRAKSRSRSGTGRGHGNQRPDGDRRGNGSLHRANRQPGRQLRLRRDAGPPDHRPDHRARHS